MIVKGRILGGAPLAGLIGEIKQQAAGATRLTAHLATCLARGLRTGALPRDQAMLRGHERLLAKLEDLRVTRAIHLGQQGHEGAQNNGIGGGVDPHMASAHLQLGRDRCLPAQDAQTLLEDTRLNGLSPA